MKLLPFDTVVNLTLFKLYEATALHGQRRSKAEYVAGLIGEGVTTSFVVTAFKQLSELQEIRVSYSQQTALAEILPLGIRRVESELRNSGSDISRYRDHGVSGYDELVIATAIPAADRFVNVNHNEPPALIAIQQLEALETGLLTSNEAGSLFGDDKIALAAEVSALKSLLSATRLRAVAFIDSCKKTLGWIAEKAGGAAIGESAKIALKTILDWLI